MISAEYDRLVEAWVAGKLDDAGTEELFRLAGQDRELAELLQRQRMVNASISGDQVLLSAHLNSGSAEAMRAQVAALSQRTMPESVQLEVQSEIGSEIGVEGFLHSLLPGLAKWIIGLAVVGVIALGVVLSRGDSSPSEKGEAISSPEMVSPSVTPIAVPELKGEKIPAEDNVVSTKERGASAGQMRAEQREGRVNQDASISSSLSDSSNTTLPSVSKRRSDDIDVQTSVDTSTLP